MYVPKGLSTAANFLVTPLIGLVRVGVLEAVISERLCHATQVADRALHYIRGTASTVIMVAASTVTTVSVKDEADHPWFPLGAGPRHSRAAIQVKGDLLQNLLHSE